MIFKPNFTVFHNGVCYTAGNPVEVSEKDAETLGAYGELVKPAKPARTASKGKKEQAKPVEDDDIL